MKKCLHVFRGLLKIARMIKSDGVVFKKGDSVKLLWKIYKECSDDKKTPGICMPLDFDCLGDTDLMNKLREELDYLKSN